MAREERDAVGLRDDLLLDERPWSVQGQIVSRPVVTATLSADHRVTDGHRGGRFLAALERLLQEPARL